jgi:hypothetical protein
LDLKITIDVTEDIVSNIGFSFQLNAYSPAGDYSAWQQYVFEFSVPSGHLVAGIEPWPDKGKNLINQRYQLLTVPDLIIRAGYKLTILLGNDSLGNVRYVTFTVVDNQGNQTGTRAHWPPLPIFRLL